MRRVLIATACAGALALGGCAAAKNMDAAKATRPKNPHASLEYLARILKEDPANQEAINLANEIGKEIAADADAKVRHFEEGQKYAQAVAVCDRVLATRAFLKKVPGNIDIFVNEEERPRLAQLAAQQFYDRADGLTTQTPVTVPSAKKAAIAFRRALGFVPGFKDAQQRYEGMRQAAMTRVAFGRFKCARGTDFLVPRFQGELKEIITGLNPEFLEISGRRNPETNAVLTGTIEASFNDTGWRAKKKRNKVTKQRQIGTEQVQTGTDAQGNPIIEEQPVFEEYTLVATWTEFERRTSAGLTLRYEIRGLEGGQLDAGSGSLKMSDRKVYAGQFGGTTAEEDYEDAIPFYVKQMPKQRMNPANFEQLCNAMSDKWKGKGRPIYSFGHKIYSKFSGQRGN